MNAEKNQIRRARRPQLAAAGVEVAQHGVAQPELAQLGVARLATVLSVLVLGACASAPKPVESLVEAQGAYERAASDMTVAKHAPEELDDAQRALKAAEWRWREKEPVAGVNHFAYLAKQRVEIAQLIANSKEADKELENMKLERQRVQLDLRAGELERSKGEIEEARREAAELQRQMKELQAKNTERGMVLTLGDVLFDTEQSSLAASAAGNIDKIADFMKAYPEQRAVVEGHTDSMGDEDFNMGLSRDRAFAVRQALAARGISTSRITTEGFGESTPVASNDTSKGRQKNRRVEIIFPDSSLQVSEL